LKTYNEEIWTYFYSKTKQRAANYMPIPFADTIAGGSDTETHNLTIKFNKDGIVKKFGTGSSAGGGGGIQDLNK
jgi:outer membrane protein assembly factor BamE (lipoprotein component of BamABCDE complex)